MVLGSAGRLLAAIIEIHSIVGGASQLDGDGAGAIGGVVVGIAYGASEIVWGNFCHGGGHLVHMCSLVLCARDQGRAVKSSDFVEPYHTPIPTIPLEISIRPKAHLHPQDWCYTYTQ